MTGRDGGQDAFPELLGSAAATYQTEFYRQAAELDGAVPLTYEFATPTEAQAYSNDKVDLPARDYETVLDGRIRLRVGTHELGEGRYTNVYDLSYDPHSVTAGIAVASSLRSVADFMAASPDILAATSGAFLYLADKGSAVPRQPALNLAMAAGGTIHSLPVVDREALIAEAAGFSARRLRAYGELTIDATSLSWSGSRTPYTTDARIFGNGNVVIRHAMTDEVGVRKQRIRVLDETSRYTPRPTSERDLVDIGLIAGPAGRFRPRQVQPAGGMDIFAFDTVLRCEQQVVPRGLDSDIRIRTIDSLRITSKLLGALSVGPLLTDTSFARSGINTDPSLGSDPPFSTVPMVRLAIYETYGGLVHLRLFDGRPESASFKGVTPQEAVSAITSEDEITWGCFLDPGRTAKLVTRRDNVLTGYGNAHYLQWPTYPGGPYTWVPGAGRPVPSVITLR